MTASYEDYNAAVMAFWAGRDLQTQKQIEAGTVDAGTRGSVTGGLYLNPLQQLIASEFAPRPKPRPGSANSSATRTTACPLP